jgi:hypothetical protein
MEKRKTFFNICLGDCAGKFARRDGPSRAGSRCQTRNRTPKRRHLLDPSSADARATANPRRARRVHAKSRRRKRSYRDKKLKIKYRCPKYLARRVGHRTQGRGAKRETGRQKDDTRSILPRPMRGHRKTRGERVACTLKVAAGPPSSRVVDFVSHSPNDFTPIATQS